MTKEHTKTPDQRAGGKTAGNPVSPAKSAPGVSEDEIRAAIDGAIEGFKGHADKDSVVNALRTAAELLNRDDDWAVKALSTAD